MLESRTVPLCKSWRISLVLLVVVSWMGGSVSADEFFSRSKPPKIKKSKSRVEWPQVAQPGQPAPTPVDGPATFAPNGPTAQPPARLNPVPESQGPVINGPTVTPPMTYGPVGPGLQASGAVSNDYWIVSSRSCRKREGANCSNCCLNFFHSPMDRQLMPVERQSFFASLNPSVPVCFVIHGSYNRWGDVVDDSRRINQWIRSASCGPLQVVFFTWTSDGNMPFIFPIDIAVLGRRSSFHALYLAQLINEIPPEVPVSLMGHSHGARVAVSSLHLLGGGVIEDGHHLAGPSAPRRIRATLIAPALDHHWLNPGQRYGLALSQTERMLLVRNHRDVTLALYPLRKPFGQSSMGYRGLNQCDWMQLEGQGAKIADLDAANLVHGHHSWASYCRHQELAAAVAPYVYYQNDAIMGLPEAAPTILPAQTLNPIQPQPGTGPTLSQTRPQAAPLTVPSRGPMQSTPGWRPTASATPNGPALRFDSANDEPIPQSAQQSTSTAKPLLSTEVSPSGNGGGKTPVRLELDERQSNQTGSRGASAN